VESIKPAAYETTIGQIDIELSLQQDLRAEPGRRAARKQQRMKQLKPPTPVDLPDGSFVVFFAGSIEMGAAEEWQTKVADALEDLDLILLNPRREAWDASWPQRADFEPFREQVEWELAGQERADLIAFYFAPETRAPISLLELGLAAGRKPAVVCCPEGFWRKGNVDLVCRRFGIPVVTSLGDLALRIRQAAAT
jgi:hypothetical protein